MSTNSGARRVRTKVVNMYRERYDVDITRRSTWGNPFVIGRDGTRLEVIEKYSQWVIGRPELMSQLGELKGKRLGCVCKPAACHGDVLVSMIEDPLNV